MTKTRIAALSWVVATLAAFAPATVHAADAPCTSANLSSNAVGMSVSNANTFSASSTGCATPEYKYFLQPPGGSWTPQTGYVPATTWTWQTAHSTAQGIWGVGVWARQQGSTAPYEAWYIGTFTLVTDACSAAQINVNGNNPTGGQGQWQVVAGADGCPSAQYRFWMLPPGGSWTILQDWQSSNTYVFDTTGRPPGTYELGVWVRNPLSGTAYDTYAISSVVIGACQSAFQSTMQQWYAGMTVAMSAAIPQVSCLATPLYQFWLLVPGSGWTVEQPYSSQGWWNWSTSYLGPGTYQLGLWVKSSSSSAAYDGYFIGTVTLLPAACSSASISSSALSPQAPGVSVTFFAGAAGGNCGGGGWMRWWVLAPGSSWTVVHDYTIYNQFFPAQYVWNTTGLSPGAYRIGVWLRASNPFVPPNQVPAYESYAIITFWLGT